MARYSLKPYQSTYVDPKSSEINEQLRQNFQQSFNAQDALAGAVDEMESADLPGDKAMLKELENETREYLRESAERGDYETMGMDTARTARKFTKKYSEIKGNLTAQQNYAKSVQAAFDKGVGEPGGISEESRRGLMAMSNFGSQGLQRNEDGTIDEDSKFKGYNFVGDVDIDARMKEYFADYHADSGGESRTTQGNVYTLDANGDPALDPNGTKWELKNGNKWETITEQEVAAAFKYVASQPDVQAALQQKADLRTYNLTDEDLRENLLLDLDGDINDPEDTGLRGALEKAIAEDKPELVEAYQQMIEKNEALLGQEGVEPTEEEIALRKQNARQEVIQGELAREGNSAVAKYGYSDVTTTYAEHYDKKWLQDRAVDVSNNKDFIPDLLTNSGMTEMLNTGGNTVAAISSTIGQQEQLLVQEIEQLNASLGGANYTVEDILTGAVTVDDLPEGIADNILTDVQDRVRYIRGEKAVQTGLLNRARSIVGEDTSHGDFLVTKFGDKTGQDVLDHARKILNNPSLSMDGLFAIQGLSLQKRQKDSVSQSSWIPKSREPITPEMEEAARVMGELNTYTYGEGDAIFGTVPVKLRNTLRDLGKDHLKEMNGWLEKNSKLIVAGMASAKFPGLDPKASEKATKTINEEFVGHPLNKTFEIFYDGQKQDGLGTVEGFIDANGWSGEDVTVNKIKFHTTPFAGEPTLELEVKGKKGDDIVYKNIIMPYSNISNTGLDKYYQDPSFKVAMEVNRSRVLRLPEASIRFSNGGSFKFTGLDGNGQELILAYDKDGALVQKFNAKSTMEVKNKVTGVMETKLMLDTYIQEAAAAGQTFYTE